MLPRLYDCLSTKFRKGNWTNNVTPIMRYAVVRTVCDADGEVLEKPSLLWEGEDPMKYLGGIGTTKEASNYIIREFYLERLGQWIAIADPRPIDRQVGITLKEVLTVQTDEFDILMENVRLFDEDDESG